MKKVLLLVPLLVFCLLATGQNKTISGTITDMEDGSSLLAGVSVFEKGTTNGTVSDLNGNYKLIVSPDAKTIVFTFVGSKTKEFAISAISGNRLDVVMESAVFDVDEVVVVAYGTTKKSTFTGSVSSVKGESLADAQVSNITNALQGQISGVQSVTPSGQPGSDATIRIRGVGSINAGSSPLYVVDGVPYSGSLSSINSNDIDNISVLKDAASAALFGSRGANGVIMITTKHGLKTNSEPVINFKANYGISDRAVKPYKQLSTNQYYELYWEALRNGAMDRGKSAEDAAIEASKNIGTAMGINPYGTNNPEPIGLDGKLKSGLEPLWDDSWQDALVGTGERKEINLSVNGGAPRGDYFISLGYLDDKGIALASSFTKYSTRINVNTQAKSWLKLGLNVSAAHSIQNAPTSEDSNTENVINTSNSIPSFYPIYERNLATGDYLRDEFGNKIYDFGNYRTTAFSGDNLVANTPLYLREVQRNTVTLRTYAQIEFTKDLSYKTTFSYDYNSAESHNFDNPINEPAILTGGYASRSVSRIGSWTYNNVLTYDHTFNKRHNINLLAGQEAYSYNRVYIYGEKSHFTIPNMPEPGAGGQLEGFDAYSQEYSLLSLFSQAKYTLDSKYNFSASVRSDGSSRFSPSSRWGTFWSTGASWNISKENFMANKWIDALTIKASIGAQGNDQIDDYYAYQPLFDIETNNNSGALVFSRLQNEDLRWESNINSNVGLEYSFWNYRVKGSLEFYQRKSKDLLFSRPAAPSVGITSELKNIGSMRNRGFDFDINVVVIPQKHFELTDGNFEWTVGLNLTHYQNVVTELPKLNENELGIRSGLNMLNVGHSRYDFFMREYAGTTSDGDPSWWIVAEDGSKTITTNYNDATEGYHGSSLPTVYGGFNNQFKIKQFNIKMLWAYSIGGKIYNRDNSSMLGTGSSRGGTWSEDLLNRWTPENQDALIPRLTTSSYVNSWRSTSTALLVDASYARLKNLSVSYSLPKSFLNKYKIAAADISIQGDNLFTIFGTQGLDPEAAGITGSTYFRYPAIRTISMGVNLTF